MTDVRNTTDLVEYLRNKMIRLAEENGNLLDERVVRTSQRLDLYLLQLQRMAERAAIDEAATQATVQETGSLLYFERWSLEQRKWAQTRAQRWRS